MPRHANAVSYDQDFYSWAREQARLLREGRLGELDAERLAEELDDMGRGESRELESRLGVLLHHLLLKWQYQPDRRKPGGPSGPSWEATIVEQRNRIQRHLRRNPGLQSNVPEAMRGAYEFARIRAARETRLPRTTFPEACPWSFDQVSADGFWPEPS